MLPNFTVEHLMRYQSDHTPIFLEVKKKTTGVNQRKKKGFKFESCWLLDESCEEVVREAWEEGDTTDVVSSLKRVASKLRGWSGGRFGDIGRQIKETEKALKLAQQVAIDDKSCEECSRLEKLLDDLNEKYEAYWYMRSRVKEIRDGTGTK